MKNIILWSLIIVIACTPLLAQVDSLTADVPVSGGNTDEEFNVFLSVLALMAISIMAGMAILTVLLSGLILLFIFLLVAAGIISVSTGVGIYKRSFTAALRTAVYLVSALICAIGGAALAWIIILLFQLSVSLKYALITGGLAGALGGVLGAICFLGLTEIAVKKFRKTAMKTFFFCLLFMSCNSYA